MNKWNPKSVRTLCTLSDDLFPPECTESIKELLTDSVKTLNDNPVGKISYLKKGGVTEELGNWRDQFVKDMYFATLRGYTVLKRNHPEKFIVHKLELLKEYWSRKELFSDLKEEIGGLNKIIRVVYSILPDEKTRELWDWRLAYQRENPYHESIDPAIMDRVERNYPNFRDKIRIKPEFWDRGFADSGTEVRPNYTTEAEYNDPHFWEGVVVSVRNPEDMMITVRMFRIFWKDPEDSDDEEVLEAEVPLPINYVEGLGYRMTYEENMQMGIVSFREPYYNLYGKLINAIPYED